MTTGPRISILTPTCDRPEFLDRALRSVLDQDYGDFEVVIFDNGYADSRDFVPDDERLRYIRAAEIERLGGPLRPFNKALEAARGEIIHPLADDDRLAPGALATAVHWAEHYPTEWMVGLTEVRDEQDASLGVIGERPTLERLRRTYRIGGAVYWRRHLTDKLGGFREQFEGAGDWDLYLRFAEFCGDPEWIERVLYVYTDHPDTDSKRHPERQLAAGRKIRRLSRA